MEYLSVFDNNGNRTSRVVVRGDKSTIFNDNEHIGVSIIFIENSEGKFLIQKTSLPKSGEYSSTGGHIDEGEDPFDVIKRETMEEIGIDISHDNIISLGYRLVDFPIRFLYYLKKDIDLNVVKVDKYEVDEVMYLTIDEINELINKGLFNKGHALMFKEILKYKEGEKNEEERK